MAGSIRGAGRMGNIRWLMVGLAFAAAAVSYLDRSNISIAAPLLKADLGISQRELGLVFSAFVFGYALTQPIAGRLADRFGARRTVAIGLVWWSVLTAATAMISTTMAGAFGMLLLVRGLLGVGEAVIFPASNRLVASWIPAHERGLANGLIFAGVGVGAGIAPPLITTIMLAWDWRAAFWASAAIGLVMLAIWLTFVRDTPERHPLVGAGEREHIASHSVAADPAAPVKLAPWRRIIFHRQIALLTLAYICFGYVAYIFFTWFFTYLSSVRGLDLKSSGIYAMLPFIAMAIASPLSGFISDRLVPRFGRRIGRCVPAAIGMALAGLFVALATQVQDPRLAAVILALGSGSLYLSQSAFWTLSADIGGHSAGSVSGLMNMGNQLGGATVAAITPILAETLGWSGSFFCASAAALVGAAAWLFIDPDASLKLD
ncbi:MFS transporter [Sphingomonas sp. AOB5]|uniref:MFS transporter n=1 Tax=Sphingomonas sp. AOB5 TaxID=3034017 RepID=UPI0023F92BC6|nr:MFS transporter [Sphingomonas sp. AOB5]MDF7777208.1 MFS transporter [Sphingomonas sp. AOB5]